MKLIKHFRIPFSRANKVDLSAQGHIIEAIAQTLHTEAPDGFETMEAKFVVTTILVSTGDVDTAKIKGRVTFADGRSEQVFVSPEAVSHFRELFKLMQPHGEWRVATIVVDAVGKFTSNFSYDLPPEAQEALKHSDPGRR